MAYIKQKVDHICEYCGGAFISSHRVSRFCHPRCHSLYLHHGGPKPPPGKKCRDCDEWVETATRSDMLCASCKEKSTLLAQRKQYEKRKGTEQRKAVNRLHAKKRKNKIKGLVYDLTEAQWQENLALFGGNCVYCGVPLTAIHKEHFIPARLGGGFTKSNIIPACPTCNGRKSGKHPLEWLVMQEHGLVKYAQITSMLENA